MNTLNFKKAAFRILGIYQAISSTLAIYFFAGEFLRISILGKLFALLFTGPLVLLGAYSAYKLFKMKSTPFVINQCLQILQLNFWGKTFQYISGAYFLIPLWQVNLESFTILAGMMKFKAMICLTCAMNIVSFEINLIPVALVVICIILNRKIATDNS